MKRETIIDILATLLVAMFLYASFSKYFDWKEFHLSMRRQHFAPFITSALITLLPPVEILTAALLLSEKTKYAGFWLASLLMLAFTVYIALVLFGAFPKRPCSCGGIIKSFGWRQHLLFNLTFLLFALAGLLMEQRRRRRLKQITA